MSTLSPAWSAIRAMILRGEISQIEIPKVGTSTEAKVARNENIHDLKDLSTRQILNENFDNMIVEFFIDRKEVPIENFVISDFKPNNSYLFCREYYSVVNS